MSRTRRWVSCLVTSMLAMLAPQAFALPPDLTQAGVIATIDRSDSYNLGPTGMRGWIYVSYAPHGSTITYGSDGTMTDESRQILVTCASTPASDVDIQVDDVILGVDWGSGTGAVPYFISDARKALGNAITQAEKTENGGILRLRVWRAGVESDVNISLPTMGTYAATAPYTCPKSAVILAGLRTKLVSQLLANPNYLNGAGWNTAIHALALLSGVAPGDPDYDTVQTRLQTYARSIAAAGPPTAGHTTWSRSYSLIFLSEYYLSTGDTQVLPGLNAFALQMAQDQSMYGTYGHSAARLRLDGTGRMSVLGYGPVNSAGVPANLGLAIGRKALLAGGQAIDPKIDTAIQRGADFFAWCVNKGSIPYGEHHPGQDSHGSNGKNQGGAVLYSLLGDRPTETEYYARMSVAGFKSREYGHTGQGLSYLWEGMGAHVGGSLALAEYFKGILWHLDLSRRTDGSFAYDGAEQYGGGKTADGTYLGISDYHGLNPTAIYLLHFSLPLKRLYITGKNANPAHTLDAAKVANAIAAATYKADRAGRTVSQLIGDISEYDPIVRYHAAKELATRTLDSTQLATLRAMVSDPNPNSRMGACQVLGIIKDATAMTSITQRLDKNIESDMWVRNHAADALRDYGTAAYSEVPAMLTAMAANAIDPDVIVWSDPIQAGNSALAWALYSRAPGTSFGDLSAATITAPKNVLYPGVSVGLKLPDSASRSAAATFTYNKFPLVDVQAMPNDFTALIRGETQCDRMWSGSGRTLGIRLLSKYKFFETFTLGKELFNIQPPEYGEDDATERAFTEIATFGDAARWMLPDLRATLPLKIPGSTVHNALVNAITSIEAASTAPTVLYLYAAANGQVVTTNVNTAKSIVLTGSSCREPSVNFLNITQPAHGTLTGTPPNLTYTPNPGYTGPDQFTFQTSDTLTTSIPATVGIVVGTPGTGLKGEYFNNADFSSPVLTRTDAQVNFDWGTGSPNGSVGADTFSVRWSGQLLVPETCAYTFSALSSDGVRLYINGNLIIDNFVDQNSRWTDSAPIPLTQGQMVEIQMEYYENTGSAAAKLRWTGPSVAGKMGSIIPQAYLYDGSTLTNRTPYAHAQTVSTLKDTPKAITLTGSGGTLTYALLSQPANGTLTGTVPYLTYTPSANYTGTDSFTFLVNNGTGNSSPATVSISIAGGTMVSHVWSTSVSGTMSMATNWVSSNVPPATGQAYTNLNFSPTGTYTVTHALNNGFQLNRLDFSGIVTLDGTNSMAFNANGAALAQINQNSNNAVIINTPVILDDTTNFGGNFSGQITINSLLSGNGGLTKSSPGTLRLNNPNNTYTGGTVLNAGTVTFAGGNGSTTPFFGTGPITANQYATLAVNRTILANPITLNGCTISGGNSFSSVLSGSVTLNGTTTIDMGGSGGFQISGNASGSGGLRTIGTSQWTMNGTNTYTGPTTIEAGTIRYQAVGAVAPGPLIIASGAKANLNYTGNKVVASLFLGGIEMPPGTYGSSASSATFKNDGYFTSTSVGTITVLLPTTTSLALTTGSTPSDLGVPLTFTATVSGSAPTGNVAFYSGTSLLGTSALNGSFQASFTTSSLPMGSHSITAQYVGNASNAGSTSDAVAIQITSTLPVVPINVVANPSNNQISLTWSASAGADGYYIKRSPTNGGPYSIIGSVSVPSYTDFTTPNGSTYYYVVSAYNSFGESADSNQVNATATAQGSSVTLTSSPLSTGVYGSTVTFSATVSVSGSTATGTVTFKSGVTVLGTGTLSSGVATFATNTLAVATHSMTAVYAGDGNYSGSTSAPYAYTVGPKPVTISGVTAASKVYDKSTAAILSGGTISGLINGDAVTVVAGNGNFSDTDVGTWSVIASGYSLGGAKAGNYVISAQPTVPNAAITPRAIQITGTKTYDGTTAAPLGILTISNNLDEADLQLSGTATISSKDAGLRTIVSGYSTPARVQKAIANTGKTAKTTINVNLPSTPANGNTLVAVISTRGTSTNQVSSITGGGVTWTRVSQAANASGTTTEIWYGPNVVDGTTGITINQASLRSAAVVMEYSGLLVPASIDQTANATGSGTSASTGTTPATTLAGELWIGGIGIDHSSPTLGSITNSFAIVDNAVTTASGNGSSNARIYALERVVSSTATAFSGGTLGSSANWSGAIATFKATPTLTIVGLAVGNYTLAGMTGTVTVTPKPLTVSGLAASNKTYDGTTAVVMSGTPSIPSAQAPGAGTSSDGKPYTGDTISLSGTVTGGTFATKHVGTNKTISGITGLSLTGAQAANYSLLPLGTITADITQRAVTVTAVTATKTYDASSAAPGTPAVSPALVSGDTASVLSQNFQSVSVGASNKTVIPSITINDGNNGGNYAVTLVNVTNGTITPKNLTIAGLSPVGKTYDGTVAAPLSGTAALQAAQAPGTGTGSDGKPYTGDGLTLSGTPSSVFANKHAGSNKAITVSGFTLGGAQAGNYTLSQPTGLTANVNQFPLTVTAVDASRTYDATTNAPGTPTLSTTLASGDSITSLGQAFQSASAGAGNKVIAPSITINDGNGSANYAVTLTNFTTATIAPKALTISGLAASNKTYDGTNAATLTGTASLLAAEAPGAGSTADGKPYTGDTVTLSGTMTGTFTDKHVGTGKAVTLTGGSFSGAQAGNYTPVPSAALTANITQLAVTVAAVDVAKTYDGTTASSGTPTISPALASGDTTTVLSQSFDSATTGTGTKTLTPSITINDGNSGANYAVTLTALTTGTINKAAATVTLSDLFHIHDGSQKSATVTTDPAGLTCPVTYNGSATAPTNGGTYAVEAIITDDNYTGSASGNLVIAYLVSYNGNGSTAGTAPSNQNKLHDVDLTLASNTGNLTKPGYVFAGWNTAADGNGTDYAVNGTYSTNASLTLHAKWVAGGDGTWAQTGAGPFDWGNVANWTDNIVALGIDRTAFFTPDITAPQEVNLEAARTIGNIIFTDSTTNSHNLTISGSSVLTLDRSSGVPVIDVTQSSRTLTIATPISGSDGLQKNGPGTLALSGANNYSGGTTLTAGTVSISNATSFGAGAVSVTGSSRINAAAGTYANDISIAASQVLSLQTLSNASPATFSGAITGSGGISIVPAGQSSGTSTVSLSSTSNNFTGNLTMPTSGNNDFLTFASIGNGGSIVFGRSSWRSAVTYTGSSALNMGSRSISLASTFGGLGNSPGLDGGGNPVNMFANTGTGVVNFTPAMVVASSTIHGIFYFGGSNTGSNTYAGAIPQNPGTGTLGIGKWDAGKWILSNSANSFDGNVYLFDGTLSAPNIQALGNGSVIQFGRANTGILEYTGSDAAATAKQAVIGDLANNTRTGGATILNNGGGTLSFTNTTFNSLTVPWTGTFASTTVDRTLTLGGNNTGANTISGTIQDNTAGAAQVVLSKTGVGKWVLSGTNTYTGSTTIAASGGTLQFAKPVSLYNNTPASWIKTNIIVNSGGTLALNVGGTGEFTTDDVGTILTNLSTTINNNGLRAGSSIGLDTTNASGGTFTYGSAIGDSTGTGAGAVGLTKLGTGTLILGGVNTCTGTTNVTTGKMFINGSLSNTAAALTVANGATLGGTGTIGRNITIDVGGKLEFDISTDSTSHDRLDISAGRDVAFAGASELTITSTSGIATGIYTLVTGGNNITGSAPATVNMPVGWQATVSISGNSLLLNVSPAMSFNTWANSTFTNGTLTDTSASFDSDNDGLPTGIEWVVGGDPTLGTDGTSKCPVFNNSSDPSYFIYSYRRTDAALADPKTTIAVEYGSDLTGWTTAIHDGTDIIITHSDDFHGAGIDKVEVKVKRTLAQSGKLFSRLKVLVAP